MKAEADRLAALRHHGQGFSSAGAAHRDLGAAVQRHIEDEALPLVNQLFDCAGQAVEIAAATAVVALPSAASAEVVKTSNHLEQQAPSAERRQ